MHKVRRLIAAAAVILAFAGNAFAQAGPVHRGVVLDPGGSPVPGAVVTIVHPQTSAVRVMVSDQWGEYAVRALDPSARYRIEVTHPAFRKARLRASPAHLVNVTLKPRQCRTAARQALLAMRR